MKSLVNHISIRSKLSVFLVVVVLFFAAIVYGLVIPLAEKEKHAEREGKLLAVVESATSLMRYYEDCIRTYKWKTDPSLPRTRDDAKNRVLAHLQQMRYDDDEHIFIIDGSAQMVMHPLKTNLNGKDMSEVKAPNGTYPFKQMALQAQRFGTVFLKYNWLSKWSMSVYEPQTTCAQYFYPWNWVVCSSLYTQDIVDAVHNIRVYTIMYICIGSMIGLGVLYIIGLFITKPIVQLAKQVKDVTDIAEGDPKSIISVQSNDEIGELADTFRHTFETVRESHKRFLTVLDSIDATVYVADMDTYEVLFANRNMQQSFGRDMTGEICYEVFRQDAEPCSHCTNEQLLDKNGEPSDVCVWQGENPITKKWYINYDRAIEWTDGRLVRLQIATDITDIKKLEQQLQQTQKFEAIGTLAGGIAHDFNNLLMGIQGRTSLMSLDIDPTHSLTEHIKAIEDYILSATNLTRQLLGLARGGKYEVKPIDINSVVQNSANMFGRTKKEIQIHMDLYKPSPVIAADQSQIEQVLINLYVNAWHAMPDGGELYLKSKCVTLDEDYTQRYNVNLGKYVKISVTDTGVGMDLNTQQQIFDPFFTTKTKGRGTGLGLASAYGIIKNHDGIITVYSELGHGTTFNLYLPLSLGEAQPEELGEKKLIKGYETILLIDDEEMILEVGQAMLEKLGYRVLVAKGGVEALELIQNGDAEIDLAIIDLIMPGMEGGKVFDRVKELLPQLPVMLSSGYAVNGKANDIMKRGCNAFIQKPFSISELSKKIRGILDKPECAKH